MDIINIFCHLVYEKYEDDLGPLAIAYFEFEQALAGLKTTPLSLPTGIQASQKAAIYAKYHVLMDFVEVIYTPRCISYRFIEVLYFVFCVVVAIFTVMYVFCIYQCIDGR